MYDVTGSVQHFFEHSKCCICDKNMYSYQDCELVTYSATLVMAAHSECVIEVTPAEEDGDDEQEDEE